MWASIIVTSILILLISYLIPQSPTFKSNSTRKSNSNFKPILISGPIISSSASNVSLDGLTIIPSVNLPKIKSSFYFPIFNYSLNISILPTCSEQVFKTLFIESVLAQSKDVARESLNIEIKGVNLNFSGSFSIKVLLSWRKTVVSDSNTSISQVEAWRWRTSFSGRVNADIKKIGVDLKTRLVQNELTDDLGLELISSALDLGDIQYIKLEGFGCKGIGGKIGTFLIPYFKGTYLLNAATKILVDFFTKELIEGREVDEVLKTLVEVSTGHLDLSSFGAIIDSEREEELATTKLDLITLSPLVPESKVTDSKSSSGSVTPIIQEALPSTSNSASFRLRSNLIGPTLLTSFNLPDLSPNLFPTGGNRAKLQSLNLLTDEFKLLLSENQLSKISFERAEVAFDGLSSGGELVITVSNLSVTLLSNFKLHANTSQIVSWSTGIKKIGEKGSSSTLVTSRSLQLKFKLSPSDTNSNTTNSISSAFKLEATTISPFTTITPSFKLSTPALSLGTDLLNLITSSLNELIAKGASLVVQKFMKDAVRVYLQGLLEGVEEVLVSKGVELPCNLRGKDN